MLKVSYYFLTFLLYSADRNWLPLQALACNTLHCWAVGMVPDLVWLSQAACLETISRHDSRSDNSKWIVWVPLPVSGGKRIYLLKHGLYHHSWALGPQSSHCPFLFTREIWGQWKLFTQFYYFVCHT